MSRARLSMASSSSTKYDSYFMFDDGRRASVNNGWVWPQTPSYVYGSARRIIAVFLLNHLIVRASSKTIVGSSCEEHFTGGELIWCCSTQSAGSWEAIYYSAQALSKAASKIRELHRHASLRNRHLAQWARDAPRCCIVNINVRHQAFTHTLN